jgi:hypothetical protein
MRVWSNLQKTFYGNLTINAVAGTPLSVNPVATGSQVVMDMNNGTFDAQIQMGGGFLQLGVTSATGGLSLFTNNTARLQIAATGAVSIPAATGAVSLTVNGVANSYALQVVGSSTVGQSFGPYIQAGTNSGDYALVVQNQAASANFMRIFGDGGVVLGAPTGGDAGAGSLNALSLYVNGAPVYSGIPQNIQTGNYTLVLTDANKFIYRGSGSANTWAIPANTSVAFPVGTAVTFVNLAATNTTISINTDTLTFSPSGSTGSRTLAQYGVATVIKTSATQWVITGSGIT